MAKRIIIDGDNDLFRKLHPVLLDIFCRAVIEAKSKRLVLGALASIAVSPVGWIVVLFTKWIHIAILLAVWWFLWEEIAQYETFGYIFVSLAGIAILYKEIYAELLNLSLNIIIIVTGGGFLRWVCAGYLEGTVFRHKYFTSEPVQVIVGSMVAVIPIRYRNQYDELMDLYLDSNQNNNEEKLNQLLEEYPQQHQQA